MTSPSAVAFDALEPHRRHLWGLCYRMTGNAADADELVQETFVRALERDKVKPFGERVVREGRTRSQFAGVWTKPYVALLPRDRRVLGEYQPLKNDKPDGAAGGLPEMDQLHARQRQWPAEIRRSLSSDTRHRARHDRYQFLSHGVSVRCPRPQSICDRPGSRRSCHVNGRRAGDEAHVRRTQPSNECRAWREPSGQRRKHHGCEL